MPDPTAEEFTTARLRALADRVLAAVAEVDAALQEADDFLQSEHAPQPWDQWQSAVDAAQDAWSEVAEGGDVLAGARRAANALRRMARMLGG